MNMQGQSVCGPVLAATTKVHGRKTTVCWLMAICVFGLSLGVACKDPATQREQPQAVTDPARLESLKKQALAAQAASAAMSKRAAEQARQRQQAAELKVVQDKMLACCESIAKSGFEGRSMDYMNAFELCDAAHKKGQDFASVADAVRGALHGAVVPVECGN